ncbi:hypothetical protein R50073_12750 [Maricurvus nonylphenolicus]|uniref:hypothetical protein n=1 Tax=Maricurvus nonylphenolicus TaxID=1008307 RepID=UPI0036F3109A
MRIDASDIRFIFHSRYEEETLRQGKQAQSLTQVDLDEDRLPTGQSVNVSLSLRDAYATDTYSRLSGDTRVTDTSQNKQTRYEYESVIQAAAEGLVEQRLQLGMILREDGETLQRDLALAIASDTSVDTLESEDLGTGVVGANRLVVEQQRYYHEESRSLLGSSGTIELADGRTIEFTLELELQRRHQREGELLVTAENRRLIDPLVINLEGNPDLLTSATFEFDMDADGQTDTLSSLNHGVGFLALDGKKDGERDGVINDGNELFGTQSGDGFGDLAAYDLDGNGWIDEADEVFQQLQVWQPPSVDAEGNIIDGRLLSLDEAGVGAIYLGSGEVDVTLKDDSNQLQAQIRSQGIFLKDDGEVGSVQQVDFARHSEPPQSDLTQQFDRINDKLNRVFGEAEQVMIPLIERGEPVVNLNAEVLSIREEVQSVLASNPWLQDLAAMSRSQLVINDNRANTDNLSSATASDAFFNRRSGFVFVQLQSQFESGMRTEATHSSRRVSTEMLSAEADVSVGAGWDRRGPGLFEGLSAYTSSTVEGRLVEAKAERTQLMIDQILRPMMAQYQLRRQLQIEQGAAAYQGAAAHQEYSKRP